MKKEEFDKIYNDENLSLDEKKKKLKEELKLFSREELTKVKSRRHICRKILEMESEPDINGIGKWVLLEKLKEYTDSFETLNGQEWDRNDGGGSSDIYSVETKKKNNKKYIYRINGFKNIADSHTIPTNVKKHFQKLSLPCLVLGTNHNMQIDHKKGRDRTDISSDINDYQYLSGQANVAKRQHCKECENTNKRFDAKIINEPFSFIEGDEDYNKELGCKGCFWYDISAWKEEITKLLK